MMTLWKTLPPSPRLSLNHLLVCLTQMMEDTDDSDASSSDSQNGNTYIELVGHLASLHRTCYLLDCSALPKSGNLTLAFAYAKSDPVHIRLMLRLTPSAFKYILLLIQHDDIFVSCANRGQIPICLQLAVTLYRMGRFGNGASVPDLSRICGLGEGTIVTVLNFILTS
jgi:hypothetical protein